MVVALRPFMPCLGLFFGLGLFVIAWLVHLLWWRWRLPRNRIRSLFFLFSALAISGLGIILWIEGVKSVFHPSLWSGVLLYLSLSVSYLISYTGVEETSPSLAIMRTLENTGTVGCTYQELEALITDERFFYPRLKALEEGGILKSKDESWVLTAQGIKLARMTQTVSDLFHIRDNSQR